MARTDTLLLVVKYIIAHSSWSNTIELHAADLPESFQLTKAVLVIPDGGYSNLSLPVSQEMFTFWCYGTTPQEARTVVDTIQTIFTRTKPAAVTMPSGTGYFLTATGSYDVISNVFIDEAGIEQTLNNNFVKEDGSEQQIFFVNGVPMWPSSLLGHPRLFEATDQRVFEATDNRVFEV